MESHYHVLFCLSYDKWRDGLDLTKQNTGLSMYCRDIVMNKPHLYIIQEGEADGYLLHGKPLQGEVNAGVEQKKTSKA